MIRGRPVYIDPGGHFCQKAGKNLEKQEKNWGGSKIRNKLCLKNEVFQQYLGGIKKSLELIQEKICKRVVKKIAGKNLEKLNNTEGEKNYGKIVKKANVQNSRIGLPLV